MCVNTPLRTEPKGVELTMKMLDTIDLPEKERISVLHAAESLKSDLPVSRVILFGSAARGTSDEHSDIDLLVLTTCPVSTALRGSVSDCLADINIQNDVVLSSIVIYENDWADGLVRYLPIYDEVQRDGCEL